MPVDIHSITQTQPSTFVENWTFQLGYYAAVESILKSNAQYFINVSVANHEQDMKQATDFVVVIDGGEIAVRIRRSKYSFRDLTIRSTCRGYKTEIHKIREGWARYYLYCWTNSSGEISEWIFVDLNKVRDLGLLEGRNEIPNGDGTLFIAIPFAELRLKDCLLAYRINTR